MATTIPIDRIIDNPWQTRHAYDDEYIEQLAADIQRNGLLQHPPARLVDAAGNMIEVEVFWTKSTVTTRELITKEFPDSMVQLAFGHNRLRAYRRLAAGDDAYGAFPVRLMNLDNEQMASMAWSENEAAQRHHPRRGSARHQKTDRRLRMDAGAGSHPVGPRPIDDRE